MVSKLCQICGKSSGIYPLCKEHLKMKADGYVVKNDETGKWVVIGSKTEKKEYKECIICGEESNGKPLCKSCYHDSLAMEDEIDRNKKPFELKDYYFNLKSANYRVVDKKHIIRNCKMMIALANISNDSYNDSSLVSRINDDVSEIITMMKSKKEIKPNYYTEQSDLQKSAIMRTLDGHIVKSQGERIIDDILYNNFIIHSYEKDVVEIRSNSRAIKSDWFIPIIANKGIYIEYWGMEAKDYLKNKEEKRGMYRDNNIPLIEIEKDDIKDVAGLTTRILREIKKWKEQILSNI